jgi:stage II sporulation protein AA (anti-sigma F factor antagonist)
VSGVSPGQETAVDETSAPRAQGETEQQRGDREPEVTTDLDGDVATLTVGGELTEEARRPLVRTMTDLMLGRPDLRRVRLDLRAATYLNSAGMAVLVQLQKLGQPRGVEVALLAPPAAVARPLQLSGLWLRFPVEEDRAVEDDRVDREGGAG